MKRMDVIVGIAVTISAASAVAEPAGIQRVEWLQGCWEVVAGPQVIEEQWAAPRGDSMIGMGRTLRDGRLTQYELIVLRERGDRLAYEAHPSGQPSAVFLSQIVGESTVVFENPEHDFPQTIGYQKRGPDSMLAWIEGTNAGKSRRVEFPYQRAMCRGSR